MDKIKQLTGKNQNEYEAVAKEIINNADIALFKELVSKDDFLFDFVKANVSKRLENACNKDNYNGAVFCVNCGTKLGPNPSTQTNTPPTNPYEYKDPSTTINNNPYIQDNNHGLSRGSE